MHLRRRLLANLALTSLVTACDDCSTQKREIVQTRLVRRMQPESLNATSTPRAPLEWGQINFLQTTDTHGWLEGHLKEPSYGADWGDFVSFTKTMRQKADDLGVDLLLVDTGDLHDGAGISDATTPNGLISNPIFENIDYDLLSIGNHELYVTDIAYEHFNQFAKIYGDKYLTSNVEIMNPTTKKYEYIGKQYRYFTTKQGLRVMAFGILFDFTGNSNVSRITTTANMVKQQWFTDAVNYPQPVDLYMVIGHNPIRTNASTSTFGKVYQAIRQQKPNTPIQFFGGHTHIRDFFVYDNKAVGLEAGRYCETLGWQSISGFNVTSYKAKTPTTVPNPTRNAVVVQTGSSAANLSLTNTTSSLRYARRYLDWNRITFEYHAKGSQSRQFDSQQGKSVTAQISALRQQLNLTGLYGCAPQTWCMTCAPFGSPGNIYSLIKDALATVVVNKTRATIPRLIVTNTGFLRFDLPQGPFTFDDSFIVSPFLDSFQFIPDVPYAAASQVLGALNAGPTLKKRDLTYTDFQFQPLTLINAHHDTCVNPSPLNHRLSPRGLPSLSIVKRATAPSPGYTTIDDFGTDGDDTIHSKIPFYAQPNAAQANASFPTDGSLPAKIDLVFLDFIAKNVLTALSAAGANYTASNVQYYLPKEFTTNSFLPVYAQMKWQSNLSNCPVGTGIGT